MRGFEIVSKYQNEKIEIPKRQTKGSAGYDISSLFDVVILPKEIQYIETGLKAYMEEDEVLMIYPRSSLSSKKCIALPNSVGVIDSDYYNNPNNEGNIFVVIYNFGDQTVKISKGERFAQGVFIKYLKTNTDEISSVRRTGGFGSTNEENC